MHETVKIRFLVTYKKVIHICWKLRTEWKLLAWLGTSKRNSRRVESYENNVIYKDRHFVGFEVPAMLSAL